MKASAGFAFFLLFIGGFALVNLRNMGKEAEATRPTVAILSLHAWRPTHIGEMRVDESTEMFVQFDNDGKIVGHAGCNRFFGEYQLDGDSLNIAGLGMTRMACPEPAMSMELAFTGALQSAATAAQRDDRLLVRNEQGEATVRFDAIDRQQ